MSSSKKRRERNRMQAEVLNKELMRRHQIKLVDARVAEAQIYQRRMKAMRRALDAGRTLDNL